MKRRGRKERKENRREGREKKEEKRGNVCKDEKRRGVKKETMNSRTKKKKKTAPRSYFPGHAVNSRLKSIKEIDQYIAAKAIGSTEKETIRRTLS